MNVAIIGGGLTGLATAYFASRLLPSDAFQISLFESTSRWGGLLCTLRVGGFLMEGGPDSFLLDKPEAGVLCRELGLESEFIRTRPEHQRTYVFSDGVLHPFPRGAFSKPPVSLKELLASDLLSESGRRRATLEPTIPQSSGVEESVADFFRRRFGREVYERIAEPLAAGVFGGDGEKLSMEAVFPALVAMERSRGFVSVVPGEEQQASESGSREGLFGSLRGGMESLAESLRAAIQGHVTLLSGQEIDTIGVRDTRFLVKNRSTTSIEWPAGAVVLCLPAQQSGKLLQRLNPSAARILSSIPDCPSVVACFGLDGDPLRDIPGSGFLVPSGERQALLACTWVHHKFPHRCPEGSALLRGFAAGGAAERLMLLPDEVVASELWRELAEKLHLSARPVVQRVFRWPAAMPQYVLGHRSRIEGLSATLRQRRGLFCIGNYLDGVGISDCIRHARNVAESLRLLPETT